MDSKRLSAQRYVSVILHVADVRDRGGAADVRAAGEVPKRMSCARPAAKSEAGGVGKVVRGEEEERDGE